jgi:hypothetical protein
MGSPVSFLMPRGRQSAGLGFLLAMRARQAKVCGANLPLLPAAVKYSNWPALADNQSMPAVHTMLAGFGDIASLINLAREAVGEDPAGLQLLSLNDNSTLGKQRHRFSRDQAEHYELKRVLDKQAEYYKLPSDPRPENLAESNISHTLLDCLLAARKHEAVRVVMPYHCGNQVEEIERITELALLAQQIAQVEYGSKARVETPLLELTDAELIELGLQMEVPFDRSWSCQRGAALPCGQCKGCEARRLAFEAVGLADPQMVAG